MSVKTLSTSSYIKFVQNIENDLSGFIITQESKDYVPFYSDLQYGVNRDYYILDLSFIRNTNNRWWIKIAPDNYINYNYVNNVNNVNNVNSFSDVSNINFLSFNLSTYNNLSDLSFNFTFRKQITPHSSLNTWVDISYIDFIYNSFIIFDNQSNTYNSISINESLLKNESNQFNNQKLPFIIDVNNIVHDNSTLTTSIPTIPDLIIQSNNDNIIIKAGETKNIELWGTTKHQGNTEFDGSYVTINATSELKNTKINKDLIVEKKTTIKQSLISKKQTSIYGSIDFFAEMEPLSKDSSVNIVNINSKNLYSFNNKTASEYNSNLEYSLTNVGSTTNTYKLRNVSPSHPIALLNNDVSNLISYSGNQADISISLVNGISYEFYHGDIDISVNGDFNKVSVYCLHHGYMGGKNIFNYESSQDFDLNDIMPSYDITFPTMTITSNTVNDGSTTNDISINLIFTSSEATSDFNASDIDVSNGSIISFTGSGKEYSAVFTPSGDGLTIIKVLAGVYTDGVGNNNIASSEFNWTYSSPGMIISSNNVEHGDTYSDISINLTFASLFETSDFDASDISVTNGSISNFTGSGKQYSAIFTASGEGLSTINVSAGTFTDYFDISNNASNVFNWSYSNLNITISGVNVNDGDTSSDASINLIFTSSTETSNFDASDITVTNGSISSFDGSGTTYSATFTPSAAGATTIKVLGGTFTDLSDNSNNASNVFNWTYDNEKPDMTISSVNINDGDTSTDASINLIFTSSKATSNFDASDITVTNGSISSFDGSGITYSATFTPLTQGATTIKVLADAYRDTIGNGNNASNVFNWTYNNNIQPNMTISGVNVNDGDTSTDASINLIFTSSTATSNFDASDITVTNGSISSFDGSGTTYSATFTPSSAGATTITVLADEYTDTNGNRNIASNVFNWTYSPSNTNTYNINVTNLAATNYTLTGSDRNGQISGNNANVNINTGDTVNFIVNASGHPFWIKRTNTTGTTNAVSNPIASNNGSQNGTVSWTPTTIGTYYYICQHHGSMLGQIIVS